MIHSILFTGHMIDKPGRKSPRFPEYKEDDVRQILQKTLELEVSHSRKQKYMGIAGAACGGDIIFHERCLDLGITSVIYLALPIDDYKKKSVSFAGRSWESRFDHLITQLSVHVLPSKCTNETVWERANIWLLGNALKNGRENMTLIALWDYNSGDGDGGTEEMITIAKNMEIKTKILDINKF